MDKLSNAEVGQLAKLSAETIRTLSGENQELKAKVASFEKRDRAVQIAEMMDKKGLEPELSMEEKVAGLLKRDDLDVMEKAVGMTAPQMKLASVKDDPVVATEGDNTGDSATDAFAANLASIG